MAGFLNAVSAIFVLLMLMAVGYAMGRIGWMAASEKKFLSKYILNIAVPCLCVTGVLNNLKREMFAELGYMFAAAMLTVLSVLLLAAVLANLLDLPRKQKGVFIAMCSFSNTIFIGLPVATQLFGDKCIPYVMVFYISNTILVQMIGVLLIEYSGTSKSVSGIREMLKNIISKPPILGVTAALLLLLTGVRPPAFTMRFMGYISNTVSPMALIYCGYILYEIGIKNLRLQKGIPVMLLCRLVVAPAICLVMCILFKIETFPRSILLLESSLPVITQVSVMSGAYGADEQYAVGGSCISIFCGLLTIPVWMMILG